MGAYSLHDVLSCVHIVVVTWCYVAFTLFYAWIAAPWVREPVPPPFLYMGVFILALLYFLEPGTAHTGVAIARYALVGALALATGAIFKSRRS